MWSILKLNALLPAIIPWIVFFTVHKQKQDEPFFREYFDREYDYIVGKKNWNNVFWYYSLIKIRIVSIFTKI